MTSFPYGCFTYDGKLVFSTAGDKDFQGNNAGFVSLCRFEDYLGPCDPYSEEACRVAATAAGLTLGSTGGDGSDFVVDEAINGCYAFSGGANAGEAYFSSGGTEEEMQQAIADSDMYRPSNYDCSNYGYVPGE